MSTARKISTGVGKWSTRAITIVAMAVGVTVSVAVTPAQAAADSAYLNIYDARPSGHPGKYWVTPGMLATMTFAQAQANIAAGYYGTIELWGEDGTSDDLQYRFTDVTLSTYGTVGLSVSRAGLISGSVLNEDSSWWEGAGDELYVKVKLHDQYGNVVRTATSPVVHGKY